MPPKKKVRLSRASHQAMKKALQREQETEEEQNLRLTQQQLRSYIHRENESEEQREERKVSQRLRSFNQRRNETQQQQQERLADKQLRTLLQREHETQEEQNNRLANQRGRTTAQRSNQTEQQRLQQLTAMQAQAATRRQAETPNQAALRLTQQRARTALTRTTPVESCFKDTGAAFNYNSELEYHKDIIAQIGAMDIDCKHCNAKKFAGETPGLCCSAGKVKLPLIPTPPEPLMTLMKGETKESKDFLSQIRQYNSAFQMTSFGATREVIEQGFMPTFKVQGQVYHLIGSLLPGDDDSSKFLQIYFMGDTRKECDRRCEIKKGLNWNTVLGLQEMLHKENNLVKLFKSELEQDQGTDFTLIIRADKRPDGEHIRRFNAPMVNEVAIVMVGEPGSKRDVRLCLRDGSLQRISDTHRSYDALQYPLLFFQGQDGYHFHIPQLNPNTKQLSANKKVSANDFYAFLLMVRKGDFNHLLRCKDLLHQFMVDMYAKVESERLLYIKSNQKKLRVDDYIHLRDAVAGDGHLENIGQPVILPSTFTGGPRYMHERTQDAMSYVRAFGRPDLFVTFTCNPQWEEITQALFPGQKPLNRQDLIARVFRLKVVKLISLVTKHHIFGLTKCYMYTIEWQKRGLPHAHLLIWLKAKLQPDAIDRIISAELPNPEEDPELFEIVKAHMMHGPCGAINSKSPCMVDGRCTKRFPRSFLAETQTGQDGYPLYRRRRPGEGGYETTITLRNNVRVQVDNRWIVPYCPLLSKVFKAHINVEFCHSVKSIKYVCKYVNKGTDMAMIGLQNCSQKDEVTTYQMARYISSNEAAWRLFSFPLHERFPTVVHLAVHLENGQRIYFNPQDLQGIQKQMITPRRTTLTAFFELCQTDPFASSLLYPEVPQFYTWQQTSRTWKRRKLGQAVEGQENIKCGDALGRVYTVHPNNFECYFLRLLLHIVRGPKSFQDLKTLGCQTFQTYREACQKRGLLEDDQHWSNTLRETASTSSTFQLRNLFAIMLNTCDLSNPQQLWEEFKEELCEDLLHRIQQQHSLQNVELSDDILNEGLCLLEDKIIDIGGKQLHNYGLPAPKRISHNIALELLRERLYDREALTKLIEQNEPKLLEEQNIVYQRLLRAVNDCQEGIFFVDAPGGTGKTFVINLLLAKIRQGGLIALGVASSGIAATLLSGGRTAHSTFKLPLNLVHNDNATCGISKGTALAQLLRQTRLIIWDECTMAHKNALEALNRTLQDIRGNDFIMGGIPVLLAGDFRQTLPVIPKGTKADALSACLKRSFLWSKITMLKLTTNMRSHILSDNSAAEFAQHVLQIGDGLLPLHQGENLHCLPCGQFMDSINDLQDKVFPNIASNYLNTTWLQERAILAPRNDDVDKLNLALLRQLPGREECFKSIDKVLDQDKAVEFPLEFLNSLQPPGMPPHNLILKEGSPIMLLRNLDPPRLCNGTRLTIKTMRTHVIEATILTGAFAEEEVFIPRIPLIPQDLPFEFRRLQFPIRLAFAMTINKAQGQSLKVVGLNLQNQCFSHGQLYVGCSRVGSAENLFLFSPKKGLTNNVVYKEVLGT